ncbi:MAG: GNAT family N-acetyltransferase [Pseudomonadota bacterium]
MSEYMGSEHMCALQRALHARPEEFEQDPLLANGGRVMTILDPDRYGWSNVQKAAERDKIVALTMVDLDPILARLPALFGSEFEFPHWQAFVGQSSDVLHACEAVLGARKLPDGWRLESQSTPDADTINAVQSLNSQTGVAPAPAYYLRGEHIPSMLTCIYDAQGQLAACASASMRYHPDGPLSGWIFAGGVSVNPEHRGKGLGSFVNAALLLDSHRAFGWTTALEQARADNAASVAMITRCGLSHLPGKGTVLINLTGGYVTR